MAIRRCRFCHERLHGEPEEIGARCPHCRRPLYERADDGPPVAEPVERDVCVVHPASTAVGVCPRCGNFFCDVCRTRWRGRPFCLACVERALAAGETAPEEERAHRRQALLSTVLGTLAWVLGGLGYLFAVANADAGRVETVVVLMLTVLAGLVCAALGLGQGAAAIRARGDRLLLATAGLLLSGLYTGMILGYLSVSLWQE